MGERTWGRESRKAWGRGGTCFFFFAFSHPPFDPNLTVPVILYVKMYGINSVNLKQSYTRQTAAENVKCLNSFFLMHSQFTMAT